MNQDVFLMHFEGRLSQQNSRTSVFVRKRIISKFEIVSSDAVYHIYMQMSSLKFVSIDDLVGFPSLRLGFGGFSQLTAGFSD